MTILGEEKLAGVASLLCLTLMSRQVFGFVPIYSANSYHVIRHHDSKASSKLGAGSQQDKPSLYMNKHEFNSRKRCISTTFVSTSRTTSGRQRCMSELWMSSIGGGNQDQPPGGGGGRRGGGGSINGPLGDFLDPESDPNQRIKDTQRQRSESRLPISFGSSASEEENTSSDEEDDSNKKKSAMTLSSLRDKGGEDNIDDNPYVKVVQQLTPSELIGRFTSTAHPRVQSAVKATILGLIGNLPKMAFETKTVTTGERLASLMFQLQMTGYMFKNAEYRLTMTNALESTGEGIGSFNTQKNNVFALTGDVDDDEHEDVYNPDKTSVAGKIKVKYPGLPSLAASTSDSNKENDKTTKDPLTSGYEVEVDANAYLSELRLEVKKLRDDLEARRNAKEEELKKDLLAYIRTLPAQQLQELTSTVSPEVLSAMKGLVNNVMTGLVATGTDPDGNQIEVEPGKPAITPRTVLEQSGEAVAQLCMWQLVVGYNLRELEVREEMKAQLSKGRPSDVDDTGIWLEDGDDE